MGLSPTPAEPSGDCCKSGWEMQARRAAGRSSLDQSVGIDEATTRATLLDDVAAAPRATPAPPRAPASPGANRGSSHYPPRFARSRAAPRPGPPTRRLAMIPYRWHSRTPPRRPLWGLSVSYVFGQDCDTTQLGFGGCHARDDSSARLVDPPAVGVRPLASASDSAAAAPGAWSLPVGEPTQPGRRGGPRTLPGSGNA
jgi:hypothetical protein